MYRHIANGAGCIGRRIDADLTQRIDKRAFDFVGFSGQYHASAGKALYEGVDQ